MFKNILKILGIIVIAIVQLAIISKLSIFAVSPNLIMIIAIGLMLRGRSYEAFLIALLGGIILDLGSSLSFGLLTFVYLIVLFLIYLLINKTSLIANNLFSLILFFSSFLVINCLISLIYSRSLNLGIVYDSLINALWGLLVLFILQKIIKEQEKIELT